MNHNINSLELFKLLKNLHEAQQRYDDTNDLVDRQILNYSTQMYYEKFLTCMENPGIMKSFLVHLQQSSYVEFYNNSCMGKTTDYLSKFILHAKLEEELESGSTGSQTKI